MKKINLPKFEKGDLLYVTVTGSAVNHFRPPKDSGWLRGRGWLLITGLDVNGDVTKGIFKPEFSHPTGNGEVFWPTFEVEAFLRGAHSKDSPFDAIEEVFGSKTVAVALT